MACEACNVKFNFFTRKVRLFVILLFNLQIWVKNEYFVYFMKYFQKQCMDCLRYFCSGCVIKRLDKILSCDSCNMLSRRPLIRSLIIQMRSKDIQRYLLAKKIPIKGCIGMYIEVKNNFKFQYYWLIFFYIKIIYYII